MLDSSAVQHQVARQKEEYEQACHDGKRDDYAARWLARGAQQCRADDDRQHDEQERDPSVRHITNDFARLYDLAHVEHVWMINSRGLD